MYFKELVNVVVMVCVDFVDGVKYVYFKKRFCEGLFEFFGDLL